MILASRRVAGGVEVTAACDAGDDDALPPPLDPVRIAPPRAGIDAFLAHGIAPSLAQRLAAAPVARILAFAPLPLGPRAAPLLLAGPPGAGKTLTVARLAARLALAGERPMVITADGARAGAIDQLAAFTRLLDLDLVVAPTPTALARALAERGEEAAIIDAPGLDVLAPDGHATLAGLAAASQATLALVLPANLDAEEAAAIATTHGALGASFVIPTRLDQARRLGAVVAAAATGLAIAGYGTGPGVADGFADPDPDLLAARLAAPPAFGVAPPALGVAR
jgi:flagellar biosynthesis protein FlhF